MATSLNVLVQARDGVKFEGVALSVSGVNQKGNFDVLPEHANFICTIEKKLIIQTPNGKREEFNVENGVLHVSGNKVVIYLGIK